MVNTRFNIPWLLILFVLLSKMAFATGEPSTYFNIFVPPNNDPVHRNACLIITAIYDSTYVEITDDGMDGDTDDSWSGYLNSGQSYILYIKDNGINDDAKYASGGVWKQDGDYFIIQSNNIVYASQSTNSDWQHDWVPSTNKSSIGQRFIIYSPLTSYSERDLNVFAYSDSTSVTVTQISTTAPAANLTTFTEVDMNSNNLTTQFNLNIGEDIIHQFSHGRNILQSGHTYLVESNKPVTIQYGALYQNARDGGGYVPSSNGSSSGDLFYFAVPYQASNEQEIRIVSWSDNNNVALSYYQSGSWVAMKSWNLNDLEPGDWTGSQDGGTYPKVFKIECDSGKKVSVFEANWMESGSPGTSDMATMLSSSSGTTSGTEFLAYMAPPGSEYNVLDPFSGTLFGGQFTHLYLFSKDTAVVNIIDSYSNGSDFSRSYTVLPGRYADCALSLSEWRSIYNGNGNPNSGPERPYLLITSSNQISIMNTNFNDNWMMYFGSSLEQSFDQTGQADQETGTPGEEVTVSNMVRFQGASTIDSANLQVYVSTGAVPVASKFKDQTTSDSIIGSFMTSEEKTTISFIGLGDLDSTHSYSIETTIEMQVNHNNGTPVLDGDVIAVESVLTGKINGVSQQSSVSIGIENHSAVTSNLIFSEDSSTVLTSFECDNWTANWVDHDGDNDDDLYITSYCVGKTSKLFENDGGNWNEINNQITFDPGGAVSATFGDIDNDGDRDAFIALNGGFPSLLYKNNGNGNFTKVQNDASVDSVGYHHGAAFVDYDNDGYLDIFICEFFETKYNQLHHNNGNGTYTRIYNQPLVSELGRSIGATWCDFDNDGDQDVFIPQADSTYNKFYENNGAGQFTSRPDLIICQDPVNSVASAWGDYDNDGFMDLFVSTASVEYNLLYHNEGNGNFTKVINSEAAQDASHSHGCSWADIDNDGDLDLYVTNDQNLTKFLYINDGDGNLHRNNNEVIVSAVLNTYGHYWSDFNQDGDLDLYVTTHVEERNALFINNGNNNHWAEFKLIGNNSNKSAIGARLKLVTGSGIQIREINSQSGIGGQHSIVQHFGLGESGIIDSLIIFWPSGFIQHIANLSVDQFISINENNSATISGVAYIDANSNCIYDIGESTIPNRKINVVPGNILTTTDERGAYNVNIANGNYHIKSVGGGWWAKQCTWNFPLTILDENDDQTFNFAFSSIAEGADLAINSSHTALRKGFRNEFTLGVRNNGTQKAQSNLIISLEFPPEVEPISATPNFASIQGRVYTWDVDSLLIGETYTINIIDSTSIHSTVGDSATFQLLTSSDEVELNSEDNIQTLKEEIVGPIDPNDLLAWPIGDGPNHLINDEDWITYKVRFQNVGNYKAHTVEVLVDLKFPLDPHTLQTIISSHNFEYRQENNSFSWVFNGINLPDSSTSESLSHGYLIFKVKPLKNLMAGATIQTGARIIFDFEQPVHTNVVFHQIKNAPNGLNGIQLIPNPANSYLLVIPIGLESPYQINFISTNGRKIAVPFKIGENGVLYDVSALNSGMYFVQVIAQNGIAACEKLIVHAYR